MRLASAGEAVGAAPEADRFEVGPGDFVLFVHRRAAEGLEDLAPAFASQRADGDGRVGRAEGGGADLGNLLTQTVSKHGRVR